MHRRHFLKLLSATGLTCSLPALNYNLAHAANCEQDQFWVTIAAKGAWDTTMLFDPKGDIDPYGRGYVNNSYTRSQINQFGNLSIAPFMPEQDNDPYTAFFEKYYRELLIINGIETSTNNHKSGEKYVWSGKLDKIYPCFGATVAGTRDIALPLAFLSAGSYDRTESLVAKSTLDNNPVSLLEITQPNRVKPTDATNQDLYYDENIFQAIQDAQNARLERLMANETLPNRLKSMQQLQTARSGIPQLKQLLDRLPESLDDSDNRLLRQSQVVTVAFATGLCSSANLVLSGFDSHSNNDQLQYDITPSLLEAIDFLLIEAERQGIRDRLNIIVGSDFGRTPWYNNKNGKDHWSTTGMMFIGPQFQGNRVIGSTDDACTAQKVNPTTLQPDENGITITPELIQHQLRQAACVASSIQEEFPMELDQAQLNASYLFS